MKTYFNIMIINGPNLGNIGEREPQIYGTTTFDEYIDTLKQEYPLVNIDYYQSNIEGELINKLYEAEQKGYDGILLNAGGYTHYSVALRDAIASIKVSVVEVHISAIWAREEFRHTSVIASVCIGSVMGFGLYSYSLGIKALLENKI